MKKEKEEGDRKESEKEAKGERRRTSSESL